MSAELLPNVCDGKEQDEFEKWAASQQYDMTTHPLHWLFLDARTYAARQGWKAALEYVNRTPQPTPAPERDARMRPEVGDVKLYGDGTGTWTWEASDDWQLDTWQEFTDSKADKWFTAQAWADRSAEKGSG